MTVHKSGIGSMENRAWKGSDSNVKLAADSRSLPQQISQWAKGNDWFKVDIITNQLRLEQAFGQAIELIARDLDYQNQTKMRRQVYDCYDLLMAKCRQIDMVCRTGCRSEQELLELEFLRSKAVAAATELAEVLNILQAKSVSTHFVNKIAAPREVGSPEEWITFAQAAEMLAVAKGTVSKWAAEGRFKDNGQQRKHRRLSKISVLLVKQAQEDSQMKKDIRDLRNDARKMRE